MAATVVATYCNTSQCFRLADRTRRCSRCKVLQRQVACLLTKPCSRLVAATQDKEMQHGVAATVMQGVAATSRVLANEVDKSGTSGCMLAQLANELSG